MKYNVQVENGPFFINESDEILTHLELLKTVCIATGRRVKSVSDVSQHAIVVCPPDMSDGEIDAEFGKLTYK